MSDGTTCHRIKRSYIKENLVNIYLDDISKKWLSIKERQNDIVIFSPYITSDILPRICLNNKNSIVSVYTNFSIDSFIGGSSDIQQLITLKKLDARLFHIDNLHAKMFLIKNEFATIGSQNFTKKGTKNIEINATINSPDKINELQNGIAEWCENAVEITKDKLQSVLSLLNEHPSESDSQDTNNDRNKKVKRLNKLIDSFICSTEYTCKVKFIPSPLDQYSNGTTSLVTSKENSLTDWVIDNDFHQLDKNYRYLLLNESTGEIRWVRVNKSRITFFHDQVYYSDALQINDSHYDFEMKSTIKPSSKSNISLDIIDEHGFISIKLNIWFGVNKIKIEDIITITNNTESTRVLKYIKNNKTKFNKILTSMILIPFLYNQRLVGQQANEFFGEDAQVSLKTVKYEENTFLVSRNIDITKT